MPKFQVTSPSGSTYEVNVPDGDENLPDFQEKLKAQVAAYEGTYQQSQASAFGSGALQGLVDTVAEPIRGAGELFGSEYLTSLGEEIAGTAANTAPISPLMEDSFAAAAGQAVGQGVGQLALSSASGGTVGALGKGLSLAGKARAVQAATLTPAFFAGAAGGADESRRLGIEEGSAADVANKILHGGSELLSESIFALGSKVFSKELVSDAPRVLLNKIKSTALGRGLKAVGQEAVEEPIAGALQDFSSRIAVEAGGQGDLFGSATDAGVPLPNPFDIKRRGEEALYGAIGALPFGGYAASRRNGDAEDVQAYRQRVATARKEGTIKPADQKEVDDLDAKAQSFLEQEGIPLMRAAAQSVLDGNAQGIVELNSIVNDPAASPAIRAAAQVKIDQFKQQGKKVVEQTDKFLNNEISFEELQNSVPEYETLNPFSKTNQQKKLDAADKAQAEAPVVQVAAANAQAGNTATAAALLDTQAAREKARALRTQARTISRQPARSGDAPSQSSAPVTQQQRYWFSNGVSVRNMDDLVANGGGVVQVQENGRAVAFDKFALTIDGDSAEVAFVEINFAERGKGLGKNAYIALGKELASRGITLQSSKAQYADGNKLWKSLAAEGLAVRGAQGVYRFTAPQGVAASTSPRPQVSPSPSLDPAAQQRAEKARRAAAIPPAQPPVEAAPVTRPLNRQARDAHQSAINGNGDETRKEPVEGGTDDAIAEWDRQNRQHRSSEWFEGGRANRAVNDAFDRAAAVGGEDLATHGMAKESTLSGAIRNLTNLLTNGLNPNRGGGRLYTAPLAVDRSSAAVHAGTTSGGTSYRDGPFILVQSAAASKAGAGITDMSQVQAVLVNEANAGQLESIRKAIHAVRPDIVVDLYSKADVVAKQLISKPASVSRPASRQSRDAQLQQDLAAAAGMTVEERQAQVAAELEAQQAEAAGRIPSSVDSVIEGLPPVVEQISQALADGDLETAAALTERLTNNVGALGRLDSPQLQPIVNRLTPEQKQDIQKKRSAAEKLAVDIRRAVKSRAEQAGTPIGAAVAQRLTPKPVQAELTLEQPAPAETAPAIEQPATDEFGLPVAEAPVDEAAIDEAFNELEAAKTQENAVQVPSTEEVSVREQPTTGEGVRSENPQEQEAPKTGEEELAAVDAALEANRIRRQKALEKARSLRNRLGFLGTDPAEQARADARVWKAHVELGYLLLKKGYIRFKIWAREFLRQSGGDPSAVRLLRRVYRMLRDDPVSAGELLNIPEEEIEAIGNKMEASPNTVTLAPEPLIKEPGYFGAIENLLDWTGNTTFFEGRESLPGGGKSHRIFLEELIEGLTYRIVYQYEGKFYPTGDRISKHGDEWLFGYGVNAGTRASRFRMYNTTLLTSSFTGDNRAAERLSGTVRKNIAAFNQIARFDDSGRLSFRSPDEVARWIASVRYEDKDLRFPVTGKITDSEVLVQLAGTEDTVARFTLSNGSWVFGWGDGLSKEEKALQNKFKLVGFDTEAADGKTVAADTPVRVIAAWPSKGRGHNPLDGFGPAPLNPEGKRVKSKFSEPQFKDYAELESWITEKRTRQGHKLDINLIRSYVRTRGPERMIKLVDKALTAAEEAYAKAYPEEQTADKVVTVRDNNNLGTQYARMVQGPAGMRPLFTNNVFETAVQLNMGYKVFIPEGFTGPVHPNIKFNPDTREVISASDASGKVSKAGDHLAVRQKDAHVVAKSEARMATEEEMNAALVSDFDFVDGLPKAPDEKQILDRGYRLLSNKRMPGKLFDNALVTSVAIARLHRNLRLEVLRPIVDATGYSKDGKIVDEAKLGAAVAAVRDFISQRRKQSEQLRNELTEEGESTRDVESILVLPDRIEGLVKAAARNFVRTQRGGVINYTAYWNLAFNRVHERYHDRVNSGFAAPVAVTQYNEEGSEQVDQTDEEQLAAALAAGDISMAGSQLRFDDLNDEQDEAEGGFVNPQKAPAKAVQLDLFGKEVSEAEKPDTEDAAPVVEEDESEIADNNEQGIVLTTETLEADPTLPRGDKFQISPVIASQRNKGQRATMRRILRDLPVQFKNAVFNSATTDRFDVVLNTYYSMRAALIRAGVLRSEQRPTFREAMDLVFTHQSKIRGLDKLFTNSVKEALGQLSRAHAAAPGVYPAAEVKAAVDKIGLEDGDPESAIAALRKLSDMPEVDFGTRMLLRKIASLRGVNALRGFSLIPTTSARGTFLRDRAHINLSPSGSVKDMAVSLGHEFVHLATEQAFQELEAGTASEDLIRADEELTAIREELAHYAYQAMGPGLFKNYAQAFDNNSEFLAYLFSDSKFNAWVSSRPQSFLTKLVNAIRKLLGISVPPNTIMDKAWRAMLLMSDRPAMFAEAAETATRDALELIIMSIDEQGAGTQARNLMAGGSARLPEGLKDTYSKARDMDAAGESKEKIRKETGWYKAPTDKQWRWEINDKDASFNFDNWPKGFGLDNAVLLGELFNHPELYKAYPELKNLLVRIIPDDATYGAILDKEGIGLKETRSPETLRKDVIHEIQHWIQFEEWWFTGSSQDMVAKFIADGTLRPQDLQDIIPGLTPEVATKEALRTIYLAAPGEVEARMAELRIDLSDQQRKELGVGEHYPVNSLVRRLQDIAVKGGVQAVYSAADTGIELSTDRDTPMWYDGSTDRIYMNPEIIAEETANMTPRGVRTYMIRTTLHENIHRADNHAGTAQDREAYMNAMSEADFEWIASMYYTDPAQREFALGRAPGMSEEQKLEQRRNLMREHRRAMIELALKGETSEQFAVFASSNPGLIDHVKRLINRFIQLLTAQVRKHRYAGSARDLRSVMETLNFIEDIAPSPAGEPFTAEAQSVAVPILSRRLGGYKVGGWATTGFLNAETAEKERQRDAKLRAMQARVQMRKDDLEKAVKKEYLSKGLANPEDLVNTALGSTENPVSPQQIAIAENLRTRGVRNAVSKFLAQQNLARSQSDPAKSALIRENARTTYASELAQARKLKERYLNRAEQAWIRATRAKQAAAFAALSPETSTAVRAIRDDIDSMQQQLLASGVLGAKTAARVVKTFGIYLTRSYQVYNDSFISSTGVKRNLWNEFLRNSNDPKAIAILDAARAAIFEDAVKDKAKEIKLANTRARNPVGPFRTTAERDAAIKAAHAANPVLTSTQALAQARATLLASGGVEVELLLEKYMEQGEEMDSDTDVLKRRDDIHPAIQALWGVYKQNTYNAFNTMMKVNAVLANQKLFHEIYEHGKANGYIFDKEGVSIDGQRTVPLGGTGTQANRNRFGALAGKYGPAELKAGLEEAFGGNTRFVSSWWNFARAVTGYAMATKTKYSVQGTFRNFVGNIMFAAINLNVLKLFDPKARGVVARQLGIKTRNKTEYDNYIKRLIELRVVSESAYEFRDLTREFSQEATNWVNRATKGRKYLEMLVNTARKVDKFAGAAHQGADDFWKVLSFEGELARVKYWEPNLTQEQAEEKAAWKIRHTMPTYTETFYFIKRLRQQPFVAPFITFTAEVYRTMFGTIKVGLSEMAEGRVNGNATQIAAGFARVLNMVSAVALIPTLLGMLGKAAFGAGEDDEEDGINPESGEAALRRFVPEYMRNSQLMRFGGKDWNEQVYMDASYLLPQDVVGKVLRVTLDAFMKPENIGPLDKAMDAGLAFIKQATEPVTNDQLFFGSIMQAKFNYNQAYDRKIYKETDTAWEAATAVVDHIYKAALEPGTVRTGRLIWEAADGVVRDGMKLEVGNEMLGVAGIKKRTIVLDTRFARNADEHKKLLGEAATYITTPMQANSTVPDEDLARGYVRANEVRMAALREVRRDYLAATQLGMPPGKARQLLLDSQLSDDEVSMALGNYYVPYQISEQVFDKAVERSKVVGQDRARVYIDAVKQYPKRQPLIPE